MKSVMSGRSGDKRSKDEESRWEEDKRKVSLLRVSRLCFMNKANEVRAWVGYFLVSKHEAEDE